MIDTVFSPAFGNRPKCLVGRENVLDELLSGLQQEPGSSGRANLLLGQRGTGKTVLLLEVAERARKMGFIVASPTIVSPDMLGRIVEKLQDEGESFLKSKKVKLTGATFGALGFSAGLQFSREDHDTKSFSYKLMKICKALGKYGKGVLILIDELQANDSDLKELIIAYQEIVGEGENICIGLAGLPGAVSSTLNDHVLTFLNRANKIVLKPLHLPDIDRYYADSFAMLGIKISVEQRREAVNVTEGAPYLMQLVGHYLTKYADDSGKISPEDFKYALETAVGDYKNDICQTALNALSDKDIEFLKAMAEDDGESRISDVAGRMMVSGDYAQMYKRRLLDGGIIEQPGRGRIKFAVPYLREHIRERE